MVLNPSTWLIGWFQNKKEIFKKSISSEVLFLYPFLKGRDDLWDSFWASRLYPSICMVVDTLVYISHLIFLFFIIFLAIWLCFIVPTIFNTSFYLLLTYFHYNHVIMIETGFLSSKILFAHRWRLISDRLENIVRSLEASNKCPARKFRPCRMAGLIL